MNIVVAIKHIPSIADDLPVKGNNVDFDSVDGEPATLFILLVAPESGGAVHVEVLANISRLFKEESVRRTLREDDHRRLVTEAIAGMKTS